MYKMTAKRFNSSNKILQYSISDLILLNKFDRSKLRITKHDCVERNVYHIDYEKNAININPFYLVIPELYGSIDNDCKYLTITPIGNNIDVLKDYKKMWNKILENINKISDSAYGFKKDYHKFKINTAKCYDEDRFSKIPVDKLLIFSLVTISNRLVIEKDNELFLETYLEECLYKDYLEESLYNDD